MVFIFYLVTTGWVFDVILFYARIQSINQDRLAKSGKLSFFNTSIDIFYRVIYGI